MHYYSPNSWLLWLFLTISSSPQPSATRHLPLTATVIFNIGFGTPRHNYVSNKYLFCILHSHHSDSCWKLQNKVHYLDIHINDLTCYWFELTWWKINAIRMYKTVLRFKRLCIKCLRQNFIYKMQAPKCMGWHIGCIFLRKWVFQNTGKIITFAKFNSN